MARENASVGIELCGKRHQLCIDLSNSYGRLIFPGSGCGHPAECAWPSTFFNKAFERFLEKMHWILTLLAPSSNSTQKFGHEDLAIRRNVSSLRLISIEQRRKFVHSSPSQTEIWGLVTNTYIQFRLISLPIITKLSKYVASCPFVKV